MRASWIERISRIEASSSATRILRRCSVMILGVESPDRGLAGRAADGDRELLAAGDLDDGEALRAAGQVRLPGGLEAESVPALAHQLGVIEEAEGARQAAERGHVAHRVELVEAARPVGHGHR